MAKPIDVRKTIATVIADMRASGDTGMVENLLEADAAIGELIEFVRETDCECGSCTDVSFAHTCRRCELLARVSGGAT